MNKDFERCCSFLADMIIKYAPQIRDEVEMCMMIKDSIDDEKESRQKQFDIFCYYLGGVKQLLEKKGCVGSRHPADNMLQDVYIYQEASFMASGVSFILHCIMEKVLVEQRLE